MRSGTKAGKREVVAKVVMVNVKYAWMQYPEHVICMIHNTPRAILGDNTINSFESFNFYFSLDRS